MQRQHLQNKLLLSAVLACSSLVLPNPAYAQTLSQLQPLSFGRVVMHDNSSPRDLRLLPNGNYSAGSGFYMMGPSPQLGTYRLENGAANAVMDVTFNLAGSITPDSGGAGFFTLVDFFTVPTNVITDNDGNVTFQVGATLRSNGSGTFSNSDYTGALTITVEPRP